MNTKYIEAMIEDMYEDKPEFSGYMVRVDEDFHWYDCSSQDHHYFFNTLAKYEAFSDCGGEEVVIAYYKGKKCHYTGWQPGMVFEFVDEDGNIAYECQHLEWDH